MAARPSLSNHLQTVAGHWHAANIVLWAAGRLWGSSLNFITHKTALVRNHSPEGFQWGKEHVHSAAQVEEIPGGTEGMIKSQRWVIKSRGYWSDCFSHDEHKLTWILQQMCPTAPRLLLRRPSWSLPATLASQETPDELPKPRKKRQPKHLTPPRPSARVTTRYYYLQNLTDLNTQSVQDVGIEKILQGGVSAVHIITGEEERRTDNTCIWCKPLWNEDASLFPHWCQVQASTASAPLCRNLQPQRTRWDVGSRGLNNYRRVPAQNCLFDRTRIRTAADTT